MPSDYIFRKATFGGFNREDVIAYISKLMTDAENYRLTIDNYEKQNAELRNRLAQSENFIENIKKEHESEIASLEESYKAKEETIRNEYEERLQNEILADRSAEAKVGTAMIDVRRYADLLISETCDKIDKMADDADAATAKTLSRVLDISSGIQTFSDKLNAILTDILSENEEICKELTGFKGSLKIPFETANGKIQADLLEG